MIQFIRKMEGKLKLGLPKGSLNNKERGNTCEHFLKAGYFIEGYNPKEESEQSLRVKNEPDIKLFLVRPQSVPIELETGMLDAAITGGDWIEEQKGDIKIPLVGDLGYGKVRIVVAVPNNSDYKSLTDFFVVNRSRKILCYSEYVNLTRRFFKNNRGYQTFFGGGP